MENIFKVHQQKIKYEVVQYIYEEYSKKSIFPQNCLDQCFEIITGVPLYSGKRNDSISSVNPGELAEVKWMSEEEMNRYVEQLNCTPEQAFKEYRDLIRDIKPEKEMYLECIDAELAKGDSSEYAKQYLPELYSFLPPMHSLMSPPGIITKLDFLKVFKEFVFSYNEEVLPEGWRVYVYLKCNCKTHLFHN
jgi:hypothetical protein